ncbi:PEP/pyruvate-binding domain-containing protein [Methanobacterium movens]
MVKIKNPLILPLIEADIDVKMVGAKTKNLAILLNKNIPVPEGFCITTKGYKDFIKLNNLSPTIDMEIYKKEPKDMRWEEIWDASLRIRSAFLKSQIPLLLEKEVIKHIKSYPNSTKFSVRSSSPLEDSKKNSYAGIHESYVNVKGIEEILKSIKLVWASLWSDRAILYRDEMELDSINSSIAVLIQVMVEEEISGLAFSHDPRGKDDNMIIEAIEGLCSELVDNEKEPEKWAINREREILSHKRPDTYKNTLLKSDELKNLLDKLINLEKIFNFPVDVEWTGTGRDLTILQSRPITSFTDDDPDRQWYLTLTPSFVNLKKLADKVENQLIGQLENEGIQLSREEPHGLSKKELAFQIKKRAEIYFKWKKIYWDDFIPFAHGIRNFGTYYNDLVKPDNPYEFMELLKDEDILATRRNKKFQKLALLLNTSPLLKEKLDEILKNGLNGPEFIRALKEIGNINEDFFEFINQFLDLLTNHLDISYENTSLQDHPEVILKNIQELAMRKKSPPSVKDSKKKYLNKLYQAAGDSRIKEVDEVLRIGRLSWKLRDDDNILLGRVENQFLKFLKHGAEILENEKKLKNREKLSIDDWEDIYSALITDSTSIIVLETSDESITAEIDFKPRQLVGQPSSPGIVTGKARIIKSFADFSTLKSGEIIICDAIQPQMTFLVALAAGIVERRGGMLVHSSIIAREMGIPAVNGVSDATELIKNGDLVTVNGYLGLVVIGKPEFDREHSN